MALSRMACPEWLSDVPNGARGGCGLSSRHSSPSPFPASEMSLQSRRCRLARRFSLLPDQPERLVVAPPREELVEKLGEGRIRRRHARKQSRAGLELHVVGRAEDL